MELSRIGALALALVLGCGAKSALQNEPPVAEPTDGGPVDLGPDLTSCVTTGPETCDGVDEDCDGRIDEDLPLRPVGESLLLRDVDDGDTGDCGTCGWVRDFVVESTSRGMLAFWHLGFDGSDPQPNSYLRMLDEGGEPRGPIQRLDGLLNGGWTTSTRHPDGVLVTYCGRVGAEDVTVRTLLGPTGEPLWEVRASPRDRSCGAWRPVSAVVGRSPILTAWTDNSGGPIPGSEVLVDVAGADGESRDWEEVLPEGDGKPGLAVGSETMVHVQATRDTPRVSMLHILPYGLDGEPRPDERSLIAPEPGTFYGEPWVFPTPTGFIVHMKEQARDPGGRIVLELDARGQRTSGPRREDTGLQLLNTIDHAIAFGGGFLLASPTRTADGDFSYRVFVTDERGVTIDQWNPRDYDEGFGDGTFVDHRGQLFLAYRRGVEPEDGDSPVQLRIWPLACEP